MIRRDDALLGERLGGQPENAIGPRETSRPAEPVLAVEALAQLPPHGGAGTTGCSGSFLARRFGVQIRGEVAQTGVDERPRDGDVAFDDV